MTAGQYVTVIVKHSTKLEAGVNATLGPKAAAIGTVAKAADRLTDSEKSELLSRGQDIISKAQVQDLQKVLHLLDAVLADKQRFYYLVVDGLDENWVEERLRYKLIMALMQTARDFNAVRHAKVVVALRRDLIERVFRLARDSGFQEEKYESLYLPLAWTKEHILDVLDRRIDHLVARRYTRDKVTHRDVLPQNFRGLDIGDYIYSIARRPRDVIALFNACIRAATNQAVLGANELRLAEGEYSRSRLRALADEWSADYPTLADFTAVLERRPASFEVGAVTAEDIENHSLTVVTHNPGGTGLTHTAMQVLEGVLPVSQFRFLLIRTFYQVGLVGLKLAAHDTESWADELGRSVSFPEITEQTSVVIHPAYRRALGVPLSE